MSKPGEGKRRPGSLLSDRGSPAHEVLAQPAGIGVGGVAAGLAALLLAAYLILFTNYAFWKQLLQAMPPTALSDYALLAGIGLALVALWWALLGLFSWPRVAKPAWSVLIAIAAGAAYFMDSYGLVIDKVAIQSVFETDPREASEWLNGRMLTYVLIALLPIIALWRVPLRYPRWRANLLGKLGSWALALLVVITVAWPNLQRLSSVSRNNRQLGHLLNPLGVINAANRYARDRLHPKQVETVVVGADARRRPDADQRMADASNRRQLLVLVVGESARASSFQLLGYGRQTNQQLVQLDQLLVYSNVSSCGTSTAVSLPCMFSDLAQADYSDSRVQGRESLLDVLNRAGLKVVWIDNNTGSKHVADGVEEKSVADDDDPRWCSSAGCFDDILVDQLAQLMDAEQPPDVVILHQKGSHGPSYHERYPTDFERFSPACNSNQLEDCSREEIVNTYDNTIAYTDHNLGQIVDLLRSRAEQFDAAMLYVADHGESTGENGMYLHGAPQFMAPSEQTHIPMFLWLSPTFSQARGLDQQCLQQRTDASLNHDNLFHSVLGVMDVQTRAYQPELDLFSGCRSGSGASAQLADSREHEGAPATRRQLPEGGGL